MKGGRIGALAGANLLLMVALVAHTVDHGVNQPVRDQPGSAAIVGLLGFVIVAAGALFALRRDPRAPAVNLMVGLSTIAGVIAIHLLPSWHEWISDPFWDFDVNALSWLLLAAPMIAAGWVAFVSARELRVPTPA